MQALIPPITINILKYTDQKEKKRKKNTLDSAKGLPLQISRANP